MAIEGLAGIGGGGLLGPGGVPGSNPVGEGSASPRLAPEGLFHWVPLGFPKEQDSAQFSAGGFLSPETLFQESRTPGQELEP